jgi:cellobiose phosphorylase
MIIVATYAVLGGLVILLLVLMTFNRKKEFIEIKDTMLSPDELEKHAVDIARSHVVEKKRKSSQQLLPRMNENFSFISEVYKALNRDIKDTFATAPAAEWLLDNFYIIEEQVKDIRKNLSNRHSTELPVLKSGHLAGYPRVYAIALELVAHTDGRIDERTLTAFIEAYQSQALLSVGELWALAVMLRIALIENIRNICEKVLESQQQWHKADKTADEISAASGGTEDGLLGVIKRSLDAGGEISPSFVEYLLRRLRKQGNKFSTVIHFLDMKLSEQNSSIDRMTSLEHQLQASRQVSLGNTITSLRLVSNTDWAEIFDSLSQVECILEQDPAGVYSCMDFESRDHYRHEIEKLAQKFDTSEINVARKAVECAAEKETDDPAAVERHIGYYLIGKGKKCLENKIGYKPEGLRILVRALKRHPAEVYIGSIAAATVLITLGFVCYAWRQSASLTAVRTVAAGLAVLVPASDLAVALVNCIASHIYRPYKFPKLELKEGIPEELSTMVIIPTLLPSEKRVKELLEQMEVFFLANQERNLYFALVGDYKDSDRKSTPEDEKITAAALEGIRDLNSRYKTGDRDIFYFFHRHRQYNPKQGKWIGWERKRGAIYELNNLLRGARDTSYSISSVDPSEVPFIRYVITLDADTSLPMGAAKRLIGTLAHPMNRAVVDRKKGTVVEGYGLLQPRVGVSINSANSTFFTRIFAGQGGIDPYTTAVSDVYQDIFGEGIFTGKGIYEVDIFRDILQSSIPQNTVLSHDLLEGCYVRAGLVTDIELVDGYPARYNAYIMRLHRWVRGDWQLLPWLGARVRDESGKVVPNPLSAISKWKIVDNMRRSLNSLSLILLITLGFGILPGSVLVWFGFALLTAATPIISYGVNTLFSGKTRICRQKMSCTILYGMKALFYQTAILFAFLPYQAYMMSDAILRTLGRVLFTRKNLLEWVTAADMESSLKNDLKSFWKRMWVSALWGAAVVALAALLLPGALPLAVLLFVIWSSSPFIAYAISKPYSKEKQAVPQEDIRELRRLARKTWDYFDTFAGSGENFLPPDNYQEDPPRGITHRTSPTNIGLLLISIMAARDLGYIGTVEMGERIRNTILTIEKMDKWNGHLYNWYDTVTLNTLRPLYVSTVDSGNFIGYLMVLEQGLKEYIKRPLVDIHMALGIGDTLGLLNEERGEPGEKVDTSVLLEAFSSGMVDLKAWAAAIDRISCSIYRKHEESKTACLLWENKALSMMNSFKTEISQLIPPALLSRNLAEASAEEGELCGEVTVAPGSNGKAAGQLLDAVLARIGADPSLQGLFEAYTRVLTDIDKVIAEKGYGGREEIMENLPAEERVEAYSLIKLKGIISEALNRVTDAKSLFEDLIMRIQSLVGSMEFRPLFDPKRQLFSIGYNVEEGHLSKSYYDLLASEARQTSFIAVARREIDQRHWFRLGRMLTMIDGFKGLVSWTGTMFEYLMPLLIMKNYENTLLDETYSFVVKNQKEYCRLRNVPWGISESGFSAFDLNLNYQYKAFGVPELGLKRGLGNDLVVAPYATVLALAVDPPGAVENMKKLKARGLEGAFGFYEAIDYTSRRFLKDSRGNIVKSFMAHHQGMSMIALNNFINGNIMQNRFHANPIIKSAELLLQERVPLGVVFNKEHSAEPVSAKKVEQEEGEVVRTYGIPDSPLPHVHILSNGSYSVMVTDRGSGYSRNSGAAVSRWRGSLRDFNGGFILYVQNINSNEMWSATFEPCNTVPERYSVVFSPDKAEFMRKDGNIETHTEIVVSPEDNAEIRRVSLTNRSQHPRVMEVTSYLEVVLAHPDADAAHPAFSNLFVRTEFLPCSNCLIAWRKPRSASEKPLWAIHTLSVEGETVGNIQYETDRSKFIGRNRDLSNPLAMDADQPLTNTVGAVLDPIMSIRGRVKIEPGQTVRISYVVAVSETRKNALELAEKYGDLKAAERAFELSWTRSQVESRYLGFRAEDVEQYLNMIPLLLFPSPLRRRWEGIIERNVKGQPDLWPFGISGDLPLVLVRIKSRDEIDLVDWMLKAHEYWRMKGLNVDLVVLLEDEDGYMQPLMEVVRDAVAASHARDLQDRRGGVFIRSSKQMSEEDITLLCTAARIMLRGDGGPVEEQMKMESSEGKVSFPAAPSASAAVGTIPGEERSSGGLHGAESHRLQYFNGIGGFSSDGKEYVIRLREGQHTPAPWINVISNSRFGFQVSESGSGYVWAENSRENKLTPWSNDPVSDLPGEVLYIRDENTGDFWSITPMPVRERGTYTVRHGFGYTAFEHHSHHIEQQLTVFVPVEDPVKISIIKLKNTSSSLKKLSITYYIRPVMGVTDESTAQYIVTRFHKGTGLLFIKNVFNSDFRDRTAVIGSSLKECGCTGDRFEFIGPNGSVKEPAGLKKAGLSGRTGAGFDPCAVLQAKLQLEGGEEKEVVFLLGQGKNEEEALRIAQKYRDAAQAKKACLEAAGFWKDKLETIQVTTPDPSMDILLNGWLLYQVTACRMWSRSAFYQCGGAYGYRDQLQDSMALVYAWPELTRRQILLHASRQFVEGDVQHWWHPDTGKGIRTRYSDDLLWLAYVTADYIRCTGDWGILEEKTPFLEGDPLKEGENEKYDAPRVSAEGATLYEHCIRAVEKALRFGDHGLPLMGSGDWNDGMNMVGNRGRGESVWLGWFLYVILNRFVPICLVKKDDERARRYEAAAAEILNAIEANAWDGSWYRRAYFDDGTPLGSVQNEECMIDSISQSWSAISGAARPRRAEEAMNAVEKYLVDTGEGIIKLLEPPFDEGRLNPGYIKGYVPGVRENGGQYTHAAAWVILAFAALGKGDKAWELYHLINPINHARTPIEVSRYKVEPYVMAADVLAVQPHTGRGGWTWYTGAAGWMYRVGVEYILGIKRSEGGIKIDPCIPAGWKEYRVKYQMNGTTYEINFSNPEGVNRGVRSITVDGRAVGRNDPISLARDGVKHVIQVVMGKEE